MFDLLIRNANLPDGTAGVDIAVKDGKIAEVAPGISAEAGEVIDAEGQLITPPFVDPHFHMDATLSLGLPRMNISGTLLEGISLWGEADPDQGSADRTRRALLRSGGLEGPAGGAQPRRCLRPPPCHRRGAT